MVISEWTASDGAPDDDASTDCDECFNPHSTPCDECGWRLCDNCKAAGLKCNCEEAK